MIRTAFGYELTGVHVIPIPRLLASVERTCVGVALGFEFKDGVDCALRATVTDSDHYSVLI